MEQLGSAQCFALQFSLKRAAFSDFICHARLDVEDGSQCTHWQSNPLCIFSQLLPALQQFVRTQGSMICQVSTLLGFSQRSQNLRLSGLEAQLSGQNADDRCGAVRILGIEISRLQTLGALDRCHCGAMRILNIKKAGAVRILNVQTNPLLTLGEPSARFGWVGSLSLKHGANFELKANPLRTLGESDLRGANIEHRKRTLCALWVARIALVVARREF